MEKYRILNILVPTHHFIEAKTFYREILGFPCIFESEVSCFVRAGGVNIAIYPASEDPIWQSQGRGIAVDVVVDSLDDAEKKLTKHGITILRKWHDKNGNYLLIEDPDTNLIEVVEFLENYEVHETG